MARYLKGKDGKFAGSIGDGKTNTPTTSDLPTPPTTTPDNELLATPAILQRLQPDGVISQGWGLTDAYIANANDPAALEQIAAWEYATGFQGLSDTAETDHTGVTYRGFGRRVHRFPDGATNIQVSIPSETFPNRQDLTVNIVDGKLHNITGPALITPDGIQRWYQYGKPGNYYGRRHPDIIHPNGTLQWSNPDGTIKRTVTLTAPDVTDLGITANSTPEEVQRAYEDNLYDIHALERLAAWEHANGWQHMRMTSAGYHGVSFAAHGTPLSPSSARRATVFSGGDAVVHLYATDGTRTSIYITDGKLHSKGGGPAVSTPDGTQYYFRDGKLDPCATVATSNIPAILRQNGEKEFWVDGAFIKRIDADGNVHRTAADGTPAVGFWRKARALFFG